MKNIIITGATGMIGGLVLQMCLEDSEVRQVTTIGRRKTGIDHPKLREVETADFRDFHKLEHYFRDQDVAFYCLGIYTGSVPRDKFREITVAYTDSFARVLRLKSPETTFCFLSGKGADRSEKSRLSFAKDKGRAESILVSLKFRKLHVFRPAYIYPETRRTEPNFVYRIMRSVFPIMKRVAPGSVITSSQLARAMVFAGLKNGTDLEVIENKQIKLLADKKK